MPRHQEGHNMLCPSWCRVTNYLEREIDIDCEEQLSIEHL